MSAISLPALFMDGMVILVVIGFIWYGIRRGFIVMLVNSCGRLLSCIGAYIGSRALATTVYQVYIREKLVDMVAETVTDSFAEYDISMQISSVMQEMPGILRNMVTGLLGNTADLTTLIGETLNGTAQTISNRLVDELLYPVVYVVLQSVLFLVLFICLKVVIGALSETIRNIRKCVLVGVSDMLAGAVFGLVEAALCLFVIVVFIKLLIYASGARIPFFTEENIGQTHLFRFFYELSPFSGKWNNL